MGGLYYATTQSKVLIGSKTAVNDTVVPYTGGTRTGVALQSTYQATESTTVATKTFKIAGFSKANFDIMYTMGATESSNTIEIKLEHSPDNVNWYRYVTDTTSGGTSTLANREWVYTGVNADTANFTLPVDIFDQFMRISIKESGVATNAGSVFVEVSLLGL